MLGGLRAINRARDPVRLSRQQTGTLFAYLALYLNHAHSRESLAALIWPDDSADEANHKLRQALYVLRRQLGAQQAASDDLFLTSRTTIQLNAACIVTDVCQFEHAVRAAQKCAIGAEKLRLLQEAVSIYMGELLPGIYLEEFEVKRRSLAETYRSTLHSLMQAHESMGDLKAAIEAGNRLLALDVLVEEAHCDLMRLYAADGQPSAITRQYLALASSLRRELGAAPSETTTRLMEALRERGQSVAASRATGKNTGSIVAAQAAPEFTTTPYGLPASKGSTPTSMRKAASWRGRYLYWMAALGAATCFLGALQAFGGHRGRGVNLAKAAARVKPGMPSGSMIWTTYYEPKPGDKSSEAVAVIPGPNDGVYVAGFVDTHDHDVDFLTLRYDRYGTLLWEDRYNGPGNDLDRAVDIARDSSGCVYVTGESDNGKGNGATRLAGLDFATIKYDENGSRLWVRRYNGREDGEDRPIRIKVDSHGVYVLGRSWGQGKTGKSGFQYALVKYDTDGKFQWAYRYDGGEGDDEPVDMALDPDGSIYLTGQSAENPASGRELDILTIKVSKEGKTVWEKRYGAGNRSDDWPCRIALDRGGNLYVVGTGRGLPGTPDELATGCLTIKYDSKGNTLWARGTYQEADRLDVATAAWFGNDGSAAVYGTARDQNGSLIGRVVCRDANGQKRWSRDVFRPAGEDGISAVAVSADGVFLCGGMRSQGEPVELCTVRYNNNGGQVWRKFLDAPIPGGSARAITLDEYMIVVGKSRMAGASHIALVRYQP